MFPLSKMLAAFVKTGSLTVIDAENKTHLFAGAPGPEVRMRLSDPSLYWKLFLNPELHAGEAYMDGRMTFPDSSLRDFLTLFSLNRLSLGGQPTQQALRRVSRGPSGSSRLTRSGKRRRTSRITTIWATTSTGSF